MTQEPTVPWTATKGETSYAECRRCLQWAAQFADHHDNDSLSAAEQAAKDYVSAQETEAQRLWARYNLDQLYKAFLFDCDGRLVQS